MTTTKQKNPFLEKRYVDTEVQTHRFAKWLLDEMSAFSKAPPASEENGLFLSCEKVHNSLADYYKRRPADISGALPDEFKEAHRRLINDVRRVVGTFADYAGLSRPLTEDSIGKFINDVMESGKFKQQCAGCGGFHRGLPQEGDEAGYCESCVRTSFRQCKKCNKRSYSGKFANVINNANGKPSEHCPGCIPAKAKVCDRCHYHHYGKLPSGSIPDSIEARELEDSGVSVCRNCAPGVRRYSCGHIHHNGVEVRGKMPCLEDDAPQTPTKKVLVCSNCSKKEKAPSRIEYWESAKKAVESPQWGEVGSKRTYGIEIEVCEVHDMDQLPVSIREAWSTKRDDSLPGTGVEFASAVLSGDAGLEAVRELCRMARTHQWGLNQRAGLHLHVGVKGDTNAQLAAINMGYQMTVRLWYAFCSRSRGESKYCIPHHLKPEDYYIMSANDCIQSLTDGELRRNGGNSSERLRDARRKWLNWQSLAKFKTLEVRLHQGTLNAEKIVNWVKAHTRFIDWCASIGDHKQVYKLMREPRKRGIDMLRFVTKEIWDDIELGRWFELRAGILHGGRCCIHLPEEEGVAPSAPYGKIPKEFVVIEDGGSKVNIIEEEDVLEPVGVGDYDLEEDDMEENDDDY